MSWIWTFAVVAAVAFHGNLVPIRVAVQSPSPGAAAVQPTNVALVTVMLAALRTSVVHDELAHDELMLPNGLDAENARSGESSVCSVPIGPQLAAITADGAARVHVAIAAAKSKNIGRAH